jgi:hypothetical protein
LEAGAATSSDELIEKVKALARFRYRRRHAGHDEEVGKLGMVWSQRPHAEPENGTVTFDSRRFG